MSEMHIGAAFPGRELKGGVGDIRKWAQGVQALGLDHISVPDHVLGVDGSKQRPGWDRDWPHPSGHRTAYTSADVFHEPMTLMAFFAGVCDLAFVTGILVLPQRGTALVAKQAAEVDVLTGGKLRLGVGVGWNAAEYQGMEADFTRRGRRMEEQIELMRQLWSNDVVTFEGEFHSMVASGIQPLPVQRPIPIWMGGGSLAKGLDKVRPVLQRVGRIADGWFLDTKILPDEEFETAYAVVREAASAAGRDPDALGLNAKIVLHVAGSIPARFARWIELGATHATIDTSGLGHTSVGEHLDALAKAHADYRSVA